jgi:hypothetical protein
MKQKPNYLSLNRYTTSALVFLVLAAASAIVVLQHNRTDAAAAVKPAVGAAVPSQFSSTGATGWWQGATSKTDIALFHKYDCFVSVQHKTGIVDTTAELQKTQGLLASEGYTVTPGNTQALTLQTPAGPQQYELHQSSVTTPTGEHTVKGGQESGYLQLSGSYLFVEGYCDTPDELPSTIPALQSIKFNENR